MAYMTLDVEAATELALASSAQDAKAGRLVRAAVNMGVSKKQACLNIYIYMYIEPC